MEGLLDILDYDGDIDELVSAGRPMVEVVGGRLQPLVGQRGATLEALQELTRLAIFRATGSPSRLLLDIGGYRATRRKELTAVARNAVEKVKEGIERLISATVAHHPCAFFPYREPQVYRPEYIAAQKKLAHHFYDRLCPLLEEARRDGDLDFRETKITALAALSLPGFLYSWYRPEGRLPPDEVVAELTQLAWRVLGLSERGG